MIKFTLAKGWENVEQFITSCLFSVPSITPSTSCGPFRELKTMFQAGKRWVEELEQKNPDLSVLARAHSYLVEHPFFLFVGAGIFLWVHTPKHSHTGCPLLGVTMVTITEIMLSVFCFHQNSHLLPQSGGWRAKEDHRLTAGADKKCKTRTTYCSCYCYSASQSM